MELTEEGYKAAERLTHLTTMELVGIIISVLPANVIQEIVKAVVQKRAEMALLMMEPKGNA